MALLDFISKTQSFLEQAREKTTRAISDFTKYLAPKLSVGKKEIEAKQYIEKGGTLELSTPVPSIKLNNPIQDLLMAGGKEVILKPFSRAVQSIVLETAYAKNRGVTEIPASPFTKSLFGTGITGEKDGQVFNFSEQIKRAEEGQGFAGDAVKLMNKFGISSKISAPAIVLGISALDLFPENPFKVAKVVKETKFALRAGEILGEAAQDIVRAISRGEDLSKFPEQEIFKVKALIEEAIKLENLTDVARQSDDLEVFLKRIDTLANDLPDAKKLVEEIKTGKTSFKGLEDFFEEASKIDISEVDTLAKKAVLEETSFAKAIESLKASKKLLPITEDGAKIFDNLVDAFKSELQAIRGTTVTGKEVEEAMKLVKPVKQVVSREASIDSMARVNKLRQNIAAAIKSGDPTEEILQDFLILSSQRADIGRSLQNLSRSIESLPEADETIFRAIDDLMKKFEGNTEKLNTIIAEAKKLDWTNKKQVTEFYRRHNPAELKDILDEARYINLLSNPQTHQLNLATNLAQAVALKPVTRFVNGTVDFFASALKGKDREVYVAEVPAYFRGMFSATGDAFSQAAEVMAGNRFTGRPDLKFLPTNSKLTKPFIFVLNALEAGDVFFRTLIREGGVASLTTRATKQGKKINPQEILLQAERDAAYWI